MDQGLWRRSFWSFPSYGCPRCTRGSLSLVPTSVSKLRTKYSDSQHREKGYHPYNDVTRFSCLLQCDAFSCGEVVSVSGDIVYDVDFYYDEDGAHEDYRAEYLPHSMYPAPPVFRPSDRLPKECATHLEAAFSLMWTDTGACANRIRVFVEMLLDHFNIEREGPNSKGKVHRYDLSKRIDLFEDQRPGHKILFDAIRWIGNLGSHEGAIKWDAVLKAFQIVEHLVEILIDDKAGAIQALAQEIVDKKGKI